MISESALVHYGLNLTGAMKKSYHKESNDIFKIEDLSIRTLNVKNTSLSSLNISMIKHIIEYVDEASIDLRFEKKRDITYKEIRFEFQKRKTINLIELRKTVL